MKKYFILLINIGTTPSNSTRHNQSVRFTNTVAAFIAFFIAMLLSVVLFQYGFKTAAKLLIFALLIPALTFMLNSWHKPISAKYWISYSIPIAIIFMSVAIKLINPSGFTGHYEFFDLRMLILVSSIIPLLVFPGTPLIAMLFALLPSGILLVFFDQIHYLFGVGYNDMFTDPKNGLYISSIMFDAGYLFVVLGLLFLKKSNKELVKNNDTLIDDLISKNQIQEKILQRKQELLAQNREVSEKLLNKQEEILSSKKELELAANLISKQKDELEFINIELNSKVEDRTRELKKANDELINQNNGLLQFSNTVSHNLRAPVASLLGLVHLFEIEKDDSIKMEMLSHIKNSSIALDTIISDLNKVVDIRNQLFQLKENISLSEEVKNIKIILRTGIEEIGATIETLLNIDKIFFIRSYLHSILFNLINNAIKYSNPKVKNTIIIKSWESENSICLEVKDNGLGIDLVKFGNSIFKMHKRFHDHVDGKGMGLYLVKQQVEAMNGKISIVSEPNKGISFLMKFPIPEEVHFQEYYKSEFATIAYDAKLLASMLIWHQPPSSEDYMDVLTTCKEMFANYNAITWLIDIRNLGQIPEDDRAWFTSTVLPDVLQRGCKTIVLVKDESDGKDFTYWQHMLEMSNKMGTVLNIFFDYDLAIEYLQEKKFPIKA